MKLFSLIKKSLLLIFLALLITGCDYIGDGVSAFGSLCIIAFGLMVAVIVYKAFLRDKPEGSDSVLGTILALGVAAGALALAVLLPEDIRLGIGIIAVIIGIIILVLNSRSGKSN